jgi:hypothetical protein
METHTSALDWLFGHGIGSHHAALQRVTWSFGKVFPLLHNDWMRILYDYGLLGIAIACMVFVVVARQSRVGFSIAVYTAFVFLTGNAFGYVMYWGVVSLVAAQIPTNGAAGRKPRQLAPGRGRASRLPASRSPASARAEMEPR